MDALIRMPNNIYEALLLELAPLILHAWSCGSIDISYNGDYYDYECTKEYLKDKLAELHSYVASLNTYVVSYFDSIYDRIKASPMGLSIDVEYGVPMHKVFECLVAAEVDGAVVGGKNDQGIDVIGPDRDVIIQCKSGNSHSSNARMIYEKLITSCINVKAKRAILAVTDAQFPSIKKYPDLQAIVDEHGLNVRVEVWKDYSIKHPNSYFYSTNFDNILDEFQSNMKVLLTFLTQIRASIGRSRRTDWDGILESCINDVRVAPYLYDDIDSSIYEELNNLEIAYDDDDSMAPWEKAYMKSSNRYYSENEDTDSSGNEDTDSSGDEDTDSSGNEDTDSSGNEDLEDM